ncbi:type II toxin-antitoxin system Phd/YefM family antitoxin [Curtobacterium sp. MCSS17_007]|uniref:type II toxin-antitoxin system Phd/YefM family antitoxin n=1 Tax=Curtobacterium sp. MCSS17_007 TaxID=2175646 RepID=UPI000DA791E2|nr:type II toxin-antitoxin system Phd/YefM family antitoxin [Curtobacterium sp. MCSS17_007]WIE76996.1 type II toxin-antitoxin system Phd/YefM family antitoxin [Curtobacterium sp. MCSS17_007]
MNSIFESVSTREFRADLAAVMGRATFGHERIAVTRNGKVAVSSSVSTTWNSSSSSRTLRTCVLAWRVRAVSVSVSKQGTDIEPGCVPGSMSVPWSGR